ncbi:hypothetical protein JAB5_33150 [Janthinobacterium sp. HH103]|jgi:hypothetical protein|uniref:hypothetical protein n=1 Tax=Janthinobacterium TaxID=29580 RepID=UPI000874A42F|nr:MULTISPECIES: hypothetical protein [Janthinobacterium]MCA1862921.1 hypothetical protein [Janthinobacterium lividum]OEZ64481.1 hypothetical protein JAB2_42190 [Janthinobacterium sp. HH100]OEZ73768.1 hypothetical protein JAB5_33150 [Janthinobacterium sp. HH103]
MTLSNIDAFDELTGRIFAKLYENFPKPIFLDARKFVEGGEAACFNADSFTGAEVTPPAEAFINTATWLVQEGYISVRPNSKTATGFSDAVLSEKGLTALKAVPDSLVSRVTLGERLVQSVKAGTMETLKGVTNEVLSVLIKSVTLP